MMRKGQTAMEYLMTYGWAILIVIIVAGALYALGVFNPATYTQEGATGFSSVGAPAPGSWQLKTDGSFVVLLKNNLPNTINITAATVKLGNVECSTIRVNNQNPATNPVGPIGTGADFNITATCTNAPSTAGSAYSISVTLTYDNLDTGLTDFTDSGTLTGKTSG